MFNPQNYKKMNTETAERIKKFIKEIEIPQEKYQIAYYEKDYVVLMNSQFMHIFIIDGKIYEEKIRVYPIFSYTEIKEALTQY